MRRKIDEVKRPVIKKVSKVVFKDKSTLEIHFPNGKFIELQAQTLDYGYDNCIVISKEAE